MSLLRRLKDLWPRDGSPGFTDHPERDIETHRTLAKWNGRIGIAFFVLALLAFQQTGRVLSTLPPLVLAVLMFWSADQFRLQALEWEMQLERGEE